MAKTNSEIVSNRKAFHDYEVIDTYEAGIILMGTEVKSLRSHGGNLQDSYILIGKDLKPILKNAFIAPYRFGNIYNHEERRERVLLLHKREILKLKEFASEKGISLIPLSIYFKNGYIKIKIGCCKGKKLHDKRSALKEREEKRTVERAMRKDFD